MIALSFQPHFATGAQVPQPDETALARCGQSVPVRGECQTEKQTADVVQIGPFRAGWRSPRFSLRHWWCRWRGVCHPGKT